MEDREVRQCSLFLPFLVAKCLLDLLTQTQIFRPSVSALLFWRGKKVINNNSKLTIPGQDIFWAVFLQSCVFLQANLNM